MYTFTMYPIVANEGKLSPVFLPHPSIKTIAWYEFVASFYFTLFYFTLSFSDLRFNLFYFSTFFCFAVGHETMEWKRERERERERKRERVKLREKQTKGSGIYRHL